MRYLTSKNQIKFTTKNKEEEMTLDEYSRWLCLLEGVELVSKKAQEININVNTSMEWIKPLAFQKYIEERFESMKDEVEHFENNPDAEAINNNKISIYSKNKEPLLTN